MRVSKVKIGTPPGPRPLPGTLPRAEKGLLDGTLPALCFSGDDSASHLSARSTETQTEGQEPSGNSVMWTWDSGLVGGMAKQALSELDAGDVEALGRLKEKVKEGGTKMPARATGGRL